MGGILDSQDGGLAGRSRVCCVRVCAGAQRNVIGLFVIQVEKCVGSIEGCDGQRLSVAPGGPFSVDRHCKTTSLAESRKSEFGEFTRCAGAEFLWFFGFLTTKECATNPPVVPLTPLREKKWHRGRAATQATAG
jgi:hypothetical protein